MQNAEDKKPKSRLRKIAGNFLLMMITLSITFVVLELVFRWILWGKSESFAPMREPGQYASVLSEEYWKLSHYWDKNQKPPQDPHPLLGWTGNFSRGSLMHNDIANVKKRRPVLLFGDSFSQCVDSVLCF